MRWCEDLFWMVSLRCCCPVASLRAPLMFASGLQGPSGYEWWPGICLLPENINVLMIWNTLVNLGKLMMKRWKA